VHIGLYGGSFDPVHIGHLLVAQAAREEAALDRIFFIPAAQSPFKPGQAVASDKYRAQMLRMALAGHSNYEVDLQELERGGVSYTIDTVKSYAARFPGAELFYIIGADHLPLLPKWRSAGDLGGLVQFLVIPRPDQRVVAFPPGFRGTKLDGFPIALSASQIRQRVKKGLPVDLLAGSAVAEVIRHNGLYLS
jgi:nicotinate-nucleotide adenylyltransferase